MLEIDKERERSREKCLIILLAEDFFYFGRTVALKIPNLIQYFDFFFQIKCPTSNGLIDE